MQIKMHLTEGIIMQKKKRKIRYDRIGLFIIVPIIAIVAVASCGTSKLKETNVKNKTAETKAEETETVTETVPQDKTVSVVAMGDNLVQTKVYEAAEAHAENGEKYNFGYTYDAVKDLITSGDLNIINQETPICNDEYDITGSNFDFNSPTELGQQLIDMGVNTFSVNNNHVLDKGTDGLRAQLDYWEKEVSQNPGTIVYGTYRNQSDMDNIRVKEVNGAKVAFLAYTEHTNGYSLEQGSELCIPYLDEKDMIKQQIEKANQIADIVIVSAHWGDEDTFTVREGVKEEAKEIIEWGADVIIGTHSHTGQTMEYVTRTDGTQGFVFYSLGNFVSAQTDNFNLVGEVAKFDLTVSAADSGVKVENIKVVPVITQYDDSSLSNIRVYPYYSYTEDLASSHGVPYTTSGTSREWSMDVINGFINDNVPEEFQCLTNPLT